ncbi:phosphotransferase [Paenibacillus sp. BSR1-1]|uniref:phosphotransferase n=1 Tax=Paenibacillus sp. BSR1-1 TaxID=3020845 RepID=UPI0025B03A38|nr:phosphotransferase [Paenibacillus sp. BSR1-1]MDN3017779.1 phosphotransferase [Paenibacillus sp. BSR1-1]
MRLPNDIVLENGLLNEKLIMKREILYKGMNGRFVERFYLSEAESYIFKPLTNNDQLGKEAWIHEQVLPHFPAIFPKILSYSKSDNPELSWMILEDAGRLTHKFNEGTVLGVVKWVAWWHSLPVGKLGDLPVKGLKPQIGKIVAEICDRRESFYQILPQLQIDEKLIQHIYALLGEVEFSTHQVLSHGDLHVGNYALVDNKMMILDWEHTHLNTPYWDLYHVLDMSHPLFPRTITSEFRDLILKSYLSQVELEINDDDFMKEYYLFAAAFSIWMLLLIQKDLQNNGGKWSVEQLITQREETACSLRQCGAALFSTEKS